MELYACPVRLFFTPQVEAWLDLFRQTHEIRVSDAGGPRWERTCNTRRFDALTVQALDHAKAIWNDVLATERRGGAQRG